MFDEVQRMKAERQTKAKVNTKYIYFAKKIIRYRLDDATNEAMIPCRSTVCYKAQKAAAAISINVIDSILWDEARAEYIFGKNNKAEQAKRIIQRYESEIEEAEQAIKEAEQEKEALNYLFTKSRIAIEKYEYKYDQAESQIKDLKKRINDLYSKISHIEVEESATLSTFIKLDSELDDAAKQEIIKEYIEKVYVKKEAESAEEEAHFTIEVLTKTNLCNVYKYFPKQREILLPEQEEPEVFKKEALGLNKQEESVLCKLYKRVNTKDYVKIRFHRLR